MNTQSSDQKYFGMTRKMASLGFLTDLKDATNDSGVQVTSKLQYCLSYLKIRPACKAATLTMVCFMSGILWFCIESEKQFYYLCHTL